MFQRKISASSEIQIFTLAACLSVLQLSAVAMVKSRGFLGPGFQRTHRTCTEKTFLFF
jgi:hypothetical protein